MNECMNERAGEDPWEVLAPALPGSQARLPSYRLPSYRLLHTDVMGRVPPRAGRAGK